MTITPTRLVDIDDLNDVDLDAAPFLVSDNPDDWVVAKVPGATDALDWMLRIIEAEDQLASVGIQPTAVHTILHELEALLEEVARPFQPAVAWSRAVRARILSLYKHGLSTRQIARGAGNLDPRRLISFVLDAAVESNDLDACERYLRGEDLLRQRATTGDVTVFDTEIAEAAGLTPAQVENLARVFGLPSVTDMRTDVRLLALLLLDEGHTCRQVVEQLGEWGYHTTMNQVYQWRSRAKRKQDVA